MSYLSVGCRALVAIVFMVAAAGKIRRLEAFNQFTASLRSMPWLASRLRKPVACGVVTLEAAIVLLVALPSTAGVGLGLAALTIATFTGGVAFSARRGAQVVCRCFGGGDTPWGRAQYARNGVLVTLAVVGLAADLLQGSTAIARPAGLLAALGLAAIGALILIYSDEVGYLMGWERK